MADVFYLSTLPNEPSASSLVSVDESDRIQADGHELPFPPPQLMNYGEPLPGHIASGQRDASLVKRILEQEGVGGPLLDFACAGGRTLRWFSDYAADHEVWGVDVDARRINWCLNYLSPPFNFSMITSSPHLPFEDRFFSFIYGYSIFTHLDELFTGWLCELRRCAKMNGLLFFTICDEVSFARQLKNANARVSQFYAHDKNVAQFLDKDTQVTYKRHSNTTFTQIKRDYFLKTCSAYFDLIQVFPNAMGLQTGLLLRRIR